MTPDTFKRKALREPFGQRLLLWIAIMAAVLAGMVPPSVVMFVSYEGLSERMQTTANVQAVLLSRYATLNPDTWMFKREHIAALLSGVNDENAYTEIQHHGDTVLELGDRPTGSSLLHQADFSIFGKPEGTVLVRLPATNLISTLLFWLTTGLLSAGVFLWLLKRFVLDRMHAAELARRAVEDRLLQSEQELEGKVEQRTRELQNEQVRTTEMLHENQEMLNSNQDLLHKNQELLYNMLPAEIADELSATGKALPARHDSVSVLFTDFSGFTQTASSMPADRMVAELNEVFAAFDDICDDCGIEKIKTIGDAYLAVSGLPKPCADHAQRCVLAGLRMAAYVQERNLDSAFKWSLRVGIHSGPVVAGVVGKRKFAFDIWGNTVNIASRMENAGEPGRVNVSAYTFDLIRNQFDSEYRGKINAKGKGQMDMYFVNGAREPDHLAIGSPTLQ